MTPQERIEKLEDALASGVLTVESDGERITYRSTADIKSAIRYYRDAMTAGDPYRRVASTVAVYDPS